MLAKILWMATFDQMGPQSRLTAYIEAQLRLQKTTYAAIARKHHLSRWYVGACARGAFPMTPHIVKVFENELQITLTPFIADLKAFTSAAAEKNKED